MKFEDKLRWLADNWPDLVQIQDAEKDAENIQMSTKPKPTTHRDNTHRNMVSTSTVGSQASSMRVSTIDWMIRQKRHCSLKPLPTQFIAVAKLSDDDKVTLEVLYAAKQRGMHDTNVLLQTQLTSLSTKHDSANPYAEAEKTHEGWCQIFTYSIMVTQDRKPAVCVALNGQAGKEASSTRCDSNGNSRLTNMTTGHCTADGPLRATINLKQLQANPTAYITLPSAFIGAGITAEGVLIAIAQDAARLDSAGYTTPPLKISGTTKQALFAPVQATGDVESYRSEGSNTDDSEESDSDRQFDLELSLELSSTL